MSASVPGSAADASGSPPAVATVHSSAAEERRSSQPQARNSAARISSRRQPNPRPGGSGFATAWEAGRIAWQGPQEGVLVRFVQQDLPFANDGQAKA
jgi:hypothetical protein